MADVSLLFNIIARDNSAGGLNSASSRMDKFRAATSIAAVGILGAATVMGQKAVEIASDTSESMSKVSTLLGKSSDAAMDFAESSAAAYGISKREALDAVGKMAAVDRAMGTNQKEASKLAVEYTKLSADLGSFNNASSAEVQEALTASLSGEYEMLKKYGIVVNDTTLAQEAQRIGMKKTGATWDSAQKRQLSYNIIMRSTQAAQGDFARTSGGLANSTKIAAAQFEDLQGKLGTLLLPVVVKVMGWFVKLGAWIENNQTKAKVLGIVIASLAGVIVTAAVGLKAYQAAMMVAKAATMAHTAAMWLLNAAFLANPVVGITAAIVALGVAIVVCYKKFDWFRYGVNAVIKAVTFSWIMMTETMLTMLGKLVGVMAKLPGPMGAPFRAAKKAIDAARDGVQDLKDKVNNLPTSKSMELRLKVNMDEAAYDSAVAKIQRMGYSLKAAQANVDATNEFHAAGQYGPVPIKQISGTRASGGPVSANKAYLVGEEGPELFVAKASGTIIPNGARTSTTVPAMTQYGRLVVDGFAKGVKNREKVIDAAMDKVAARISAAVERMKAAVERSREIARGIRDTFASFADLSNVETGPGFLAELHKRADHAEAFARGITALRKKGLSKAAIAQLVSAGPEGGLAAVEQLLNSGGIQEVNAQLARIRSAGAGLGVREAIARTGVDPRVNMRAVIGRGREKQTVELKLSSDGGDLVEAIVKALRKKVRASGGDVQVVLGTRG